MSKENTKGVLPFVPSYYFICQHGFPGGSDGQESSCNAEDLVKRSGKGNSYPLQYSCLNSMDRNLVGYSPWGGSRTQLSDPHTTWLTVKNLGELQVLFVVC